MDGIGRHKNNGICIRNVGWNVFNDINYCRSITTEKGARKMTLEEFAKDAGVSIVDCGEGWGGRLGYTEIDLPNCSTCGFKTEKAAYKSWLEDKFGKQTAKAILKLLKKVNK